MLERTTELVSSVVVVPASSAHGVGEHSFAFSDTQPELLSRREIVFPCVETGHSAVHVVRCFGMRDDDGDPHFLFYDVADFLDGRLTGVYAGSRVLRCRCCSFGEQSFHGGVRRLCDD